MSRTEQASRRESSGGRPDIEFRPIHNGMDYLESAVTHLTEGQMPPGARDLKYAVLHLHAATEVLLKAALVREHWSLVFKDPARASAKDYYDGSFSSTTIEGVITRLREIAGVDIGEQNRLAVKKLSDTRNAFMHYGLTASAYAVEGQAAKVLSFLLDFLEEYLVQDYGETPHPDTLSVRASLGRTRTRLGRIDSLVKARMGDVTAGLKDEGLLSRTIQCPACRQYAVPVIGEETKCRFCNAGGRRGELLVAYAKDVVSAGVAYELYCPSCLEIDTVAHPTVLVGVRTAASPDADVALCFECDAVWASQDLAALLEVPFIQVPGRFLPPPRVSGHAKDDQGRAIRNR
jgi:hypothetical protein